MQIKLSHLESFAKKHLSSSPEETFLLGSEIGSHLKGGEVFYLVGDLGAGKTTFVKGIVKGLSSSDIVSSPTFTFMHTYPGTIDVHHFDLYRLNNGADFFHMGFDEFFNSNSVTLIEWPEQVMPLLKGSYVEIQFSLVDENKRSLTLSLKEKE